MSWPATDEDWLLVPEHLREGLRIYILDGCPPVGFLTAVLENDLCESFARADEKSRAGLGDLVCFLYNHVPAGAWGSSYRVATWVRCGGLKGQLRRGGA